MSESALVAKSIRAWLVLPIAAAREVAAYLPSNQCVELSLSDDQRLPRLNLIHQIQATANIAAAHLLTAA